MVGSMGRLVGPLLISNLYIIFGPRITWAIQIFLLIVTISVWILVYKRLVPLECK
jgi:hypothetical protein